MTTGKDIDDDVLWHKISFAFPIWMYDVGLGTDDRAEYVYKVRKRQERFTCCHPWWMSLPLSPGPVRVGVRQAAALLSQARHNVIMYHFLNYISTLMPSRDQPTHPGQPVLSAFCLVKNLPRVRVETEKEHHHWGKLNFHWLLLEDETKTFIPVGLWKCTKVVHH